MVPVILILNFTRYATQVNGQNINAVTEVAERTHNDMNTLFNIKSSLYIYINYQQNTPSHLLHSGQSQGFLYYMRQIAMHTKDYIHAATTSILSPHVFLVEDFQEMLTHTETKLPLTMDLTESLHDTLYFYVYLHTHILVAKEQFLLLNDVSVHNNLRSTKSLAYSYQKGTSQHNMT